MLVHLALALLAHSPSLAPPEPRDTCPPPAAADTVTAAVVATLEPVDPADSLPPGYDRQFLAEVARRLELPNPLPLAVYRRIGPRQTDPPRRTRSGHGEDPSPGEQAFRLLLAVRLGDGNDAQASVAASSLSQAADSAALAAVQRLIADGLVTSLRGRAIDTRLLMRTVDSVAPSDLVLFRYRTPRVSFHESAVRSAPAPRYPDNLRTRRESGQVVAEFVVWPDGRMIPGSLRFISGTHREFARSVAASLPNYQFRPALIDGCAVPQLVEMPFVFSIR